MNRLIGEFDYNSVDWDGASDKHAKELDCIVKNIALDYLKSLFTQEGTLYNYEPFIFTLKGDIDKLKPKPLEIFYPIDDGIYIRVDIGAILKNIKEDYIDGIGEIEVYRDFAKNLKLLSDEMLITLNTVEINLKP